ncbi:MAG: hypothetical protein AB1Z65_15885 [Candidatus Sulfomarinibacteraceae bacterium]
MEKLIRIIVVATGMVAFSLLDLISLGLVPEAEAIAGVRRRTARRTAVVVGGTATAEVAAANASAAAAQQQAAQANADAAAAQQQAAAAQQQAAAPQQPAPAPTPMITALPAGCVNTGQVYQCGDVYYKPYLQGTAVVYAQVPAPQ